MRCVDALVHQADLAMYMPRRGKNNYQLYQPLMNVVAVGWIKADADAGGRASTIGEVSSTRRPNFENDAIDDRSRLVVAEADLVLLHLAAPFHVNPVCAVDQNIADGRVLQEHLQWPEAEGARGWFDVFR